MKFNHKIHHRKSIRLKEYDYSTPGIYFVTILAKNRENLFGEIDLLVRAQNLEPLQLQDTLSQNQFQKIIPKSLGSIIRGFKIGVTKWSRQNGNIYEVFHRNYYKHIIRNEKSLEKIRDYIVNNPFNWQKDEYFS